MKLSKPDILGLISFFSYADMGIGPVGNGLLPQSVFGLFERFGAFAVVVFNAAPACICSLESLIQIAQRKYGG